MAVREERTNQMRSHKERLTNVRALQQSITQEDTSTRVLTFVIGFVSSRIKSLSKTLSGQRTCCYAACVACLACLKTGLCSYLVIRILCMDGNAQKRCPISCNVSHSSVVLRFPHFSGVTDSQNNRLFFFVGWVQTLCSNALNFKRRPSALFRRRTDFVALNWALALHLQTLRKTRRKNAKLCYSHGSNWWMRVCCLLSRLHSSTHRSAAQKCICQSRLDVALYRAGSLISAG